MNNSSTRYDVRAVKTAVTHYRHREEKATSAKLAKKCRGGK